MPPPEVWGPHIWRMFHTLIEKINDEAYPIIYKQLVFHIERICRDLPCPDCANHATKYLTKANLSNNKTKIELKNALYLFHNYVNARKKKPLYNYENINVYKNYKLIQIINNFFLNYRTRGNMNLITESFQRDIITKEFRQWLNRNSKAFISKAEMSEQIPRQIPEKTNETENA
jgi:hypothetical protein